MTARIVRNSWTLQTFIDVEFSQSGACVQSVTAPDHRLPSTRSQHRLKRIRMFAVLDPLRINDLSRWRSLCAALNINSPIKSA
jgi:hypothetical protein